MPASPSQPRVNPPAPLAADRPVEVLTAEPRPIRVALAHDWLCGLRGGEKVLEHIARVVLARAGDQASNQGNGLTPLYTMFDDGRPMSPSVDRLRRVSSPLMSVPGALKLRRWMLPLYPAAVGALSKQLARDHDREPFDLVISTSSAAIKGLRPPPGVPHLCYCHSPARYVWSLRDESSRGLARLGLAAYSERFKAWDRATSANVTHFIANSSHTSREIARHFDRASEVLYPPVDTEYYTPDRAASRGDFWLVVGAIEPYKRTDLAIEAAARAGKRLLIVGTGSAEPALRRSAPRSVEFLGRLPDAELRDLYRRAALLLFPQVEDFGIIAAEALACGLPVVARRAGGALDIVDDGVTGTLFDDATADALRDAALRAERMLSDEVRRACRRKAELFSVTNFERGIASFIDAVLTR